MSKGNSIKTRVKLKVNFLLQIIDFARSLQVELAERCRALHKKYKLIAARQKVFFKKESKFLEISRIRTTGFFVWWQGSESCQVLVFSKLIPHESLLDTTYDYLRPWDLRVNLTAELVELEPLKLDFHLGSTKLALLLLLLKDVYGHWVKIETGQRRARKEDKMVTWEKISLFLRLESWYDDGWGCNRRWFRLTMSVHVCTVENLRFFSASPFAAGATITEPLFSPLLILGMSTCCLEGTSVGTWGEFWLTGILTVTYRFFDVIDFSFL